MEVGGCTWHLAPCTHHGTPCTMPPSSIVWDSPNAYKVSFWLEKIIKKFHHFWTSFGMDFLENKKHAENKNWHLALDQ